MAQSSNRSPITGKRWEATKHPVFFTVKMSDGEEALTVVVAGSDEADAKVQAEWENPGYSAVSVERAEGGDAR